MTDSRPVNDNQSFTALFKNDKRDRAEDAFVILVESLKNDGVDRATIIRTLYEMFLYELDQTRDGTGLATGIDLIENIAVVEEVDARWKILREQWKVKIPDLFYPHG